MGTDVSEEHTVSIFSVAMNVRRSLCKFSLSFVRLYPNLKRADRLYRNSAVSTLRPVLPPGGRKDVPRGYADERTGLYGVVPQKTASSQPSCHNRVDMCNNIKMNVKKAVGEVV